MREKSKSGSAPSRTYIYEYIKCMYSILFLHQEIIRAHVVTMFAITNNLLLSVLSVHL